MGDIQVHDQRFKPYISSKDVQSRVAELATQMADDFADEVPVFIGVLNGAFRFASDLLAGYTGECEISFIKLASYQGTQSSGHIKELASLNTSLKGRKIIVLEDIVDTGRTIDYLMDLLSVHEPAEIRIASLLLKPDVYRGSHSIDYCGFEIPNLFVLGYGLDFDGLGRNLNDIYQIKS